MKKLIVLLLIINFYSILPFILHAQDVNKGFEYFKAEEYEQAAIQFENALPEIKAVYGENDTTYYSKIVFYTASSYERALNYKKAEDYYLQGILIYKSIKDGADNYFYSVYINNLALLYQNLGKFSDVEPLLIESKNYYKRTVGEQHHIYAISCNNMAVLYQNLGRYSEAELELIEAKNIYENNYGKKNHDYAISCRNLAELYNTMGKFSEAKVLSIESKDIIEKLFGKNHQSYAKSCENLALIYHEINDFDKAEQLYIETKTIRETVLGKNHHEYATSCNNLALLYLSIGKYSEAEILLIEAKNIYANFHGKEHPEYALSCSNLGLLYDAIAHYSKAEPLFIEAKNIDERVFGKEHIKYATDCSNLAAFYLTIGNYSKAEKLFIEAKNINEKVFGIEHHEYAKSCNNLAALYYTINNYSKAEYLLLEVKRIDEKVFGKEHRTYAIDCSNLAGLYDAIGNYTKAEELYIESKKINKKLFGKEHPTHADDCSNLGLVYHKNGKYSKAKKLFNEALTIDINAFGKKHPNYARDCNHIAALYYDTGNHSKAMTFFIEANKNLNHQVLQSGVFMSEKEREKFLQTKVYFYYEYYNSFYLKHKTINQYITGISYDNALLMKGLLLRSNIAMRESILNSKDENLINTYNEWLEKGSLLMSEKDKPIAEQTINIDSLRENVNNLEKSLIKSSDPFGRVGTLEDNKWQNIQNSLAQNEAAIEFINFNLWENNRWTDSTYYCALILTKNMEYPEMIYLFEEQELDTILYKNPEFKELFENPEYEYIKSIYDFQSANSKRLYELIWQPIEPFLGDIEKIYFSPSGLLNRIAFDAIPNTDSTLISDSYQLFYQTTTANKIYEKEFFKKDIKNAVLFGGINYSADTTAWKTSAMLYHKKNTYARSLQGNLDEIASLTELNRGGYEYWSYLKETKTEAENIDSLLKLYKISSKFFTGTEATEEVFKSLSNNAPSLLHIATHGFYFPQKMKKNHQVQNLEGLNYIFSENPLLRSGLLFAGANHTWNGNIVEDIEDGTLSAYEVSQMNLFGCKLVVLSACQTGLGDVNGSEGVYGLQRGFKMSGVDFMIYSLWEVPDMQTQELMSDFYTYWFSGLNIRQAFKKAQTDMKNKYKNVKGAAYAWAAFVLIN